MKEDLMRQAIGDIDDKLIEGAEKQNSAKRPRLSWVKWGSIAAAFVLIVAIGIMALPGMLKIDTPVVTPDTPSISGNEGGEIITPNGVSGEMAPFTKYKYAIDEGGYTTYIQGKAIADKFVGDKLEDVTVTGGWMYTNGGEFWRADEHARAEIYEIEGVSADVAVAIKFLDELEAQTTTMYYVIMNPTADLTPVQSYVITYDDPAQNDGE